MRYLITNRSGVTDEALQAAVGEELNPLPADLRDKYFLSAMQEVARRLRLDMDAVSDVESVRVVFRARGVAP